MVVDKLIIVLALLTPAGAARADEGDLKPPDLEWSYLYDGGAVVAPREPPLFFSAEEGGAEVKEDSVPTWTIADLALYLRYHGFESLRGKRFLPWWEGLTCFGLKVPTWWNSPVALRLISLIRLMRRKASSKS